MEFRGFRHGSESQDSDEPVVPGTVFDDKAVPSPSTSTPSPVTSTSSKGVENAKKRLRAFSIQKKAPVGPVTVVKPISTGNATVLIGKLCSTKVTPKPEKPVDDDKKIPKPPKPGGTKKYLNESYSDLQKKTLSEIEEMKRKLELVELGIPLGLVCPSTNALPVKAMPTKAMPPIKTFLADSFRVVDAKPPAQKTSSVKKNNAKIDEIIREARKAKAEGKEFKFDYQKFVPDYDNPFQRKRDAAEDQPETDEKKEEEYKKPRFDKDKRFQENKDRRKSDKFERRHDFKRDDRIKFRDKSRAREKDKKEEQRIKNKDDKSRDKEVKSKDKDDKYKKDDRHVRRDFDDLNDKAKVEQKEETKKHTENLQEKHKDKDGKETDVNLKDFLVCDSWSLDTEGKNSPQVEHKSKKGIEDKFKKLTTPFDPLQQLRQSLGKRSLGSPQPKIEKLKPVVDCFEFEIDPNEDEVLDAFDGKGTKPKKDNLYDSPVHIKYDMRKDLSSDGMNDDIFLESVINEIKQEDMSDDDHHDKGLVEYDESPVRDSNEPSVGSVTPDLEDSIRSQSQRSDYSDGYKSVDSRKSSESGYKSTESGYKSEGKAEACYKSDPKFTGTSFKPIEPAQKSNEYEPKTDRFKSTFKPADNASEPTERRSRSSESHSKSPNNSKDRSKSSEGSLKHEPAQKPKNKPFKEERELVSVERELDEALEAKMSKDTVDSLETWSFVLKICQPLLFRHDKNKCYKETRTTPKLWFTQNPRLCDCVMDRTIVYEELERCKMDLVDRLYGCDQIPDPPLVIARSWYPQLDQCVVAHAAPLALASEWDVEEEARPLPQRAPPGGRHDDESLDREYQRFMEAVSWSETQPGQEGRSLTPERAEPPERARAEHEPGEPRAKRARATSDCWSQESEPEEDKTKAAKRQKARRKRRRSASPSPPAPAPAPALAPAPGAERRKRKTKKKDDKKTKLKAKRRRLEKKVLKKLKEKKKKKKEKVQESDFEDEEEIEPKKKDKKVKKKKLQKTKKKAEKKKKRAKSTSTSSSDSSSSESSSDSDPSEKRARRKKEVQVKKKKKKEKKKRRKQSSSDSQSEELFDVNILNNIKAERLTDDERRAPLAPPASPPAPGGRGPHREIINVNQLHDHFSSNVQVKQEVEEESNSVQPPKESPKTEEPQEETKITEEVISKEKENSNEGEETPKIVEEVPKEVEVLKKVEEVPRSVKKVSKKVEAVSKKVEVAKKVEVLKRVDSEAELMNRFDLDEPYGAAQDKTEKIEFKEPIAPTPPLRDETSQCSSQESIQSITSGKEPAYEKDDSHLRPSCDNSNYSFNDVINSQSGYKNMEEKFEGYENYEMYEQMAMAYQSDVASQQISPPSCVGEQRIETVVRAHARGEIKCDWRPSDPPAPAAPRPSRWGLKPGEVNIVLTGGEQHDPRVSTATSQPVYKIQSLANRDSSMGYDEAYMSMYGAADRLQYGDCFAPPAPPRRADPRPGSLDDRINRALRHNVLGEVAKEENGDKETPEKGILVTAVGARGGKRVSFADGYKPGQDSDTEQPPVKKRAKPVYGCAWPCPMGHPAHVPLWDALPPPPPPPGSPPPARPAVPPPLHLLRRPPPHTEIAPHTHHNKRDPAASIPSFMPPEPPPGLITFT